MSATASVMDGIYRRQRHFYDLTRRYYLLGRDRLIAELAPPPGGTVLEVGCGTARNLAIAAARYPEAQFFGIDISTEMLKTARATLSRKRLDERIRLEAADAANFDVAHLFGASGFDRIFFSYSLSMIPAWREALAAAIDNLAPGGELLIVDFSNQTRLPRFFRRTLLAWLARFQVTPRTQLPAELETLSAAYGGHVTIEPVFRDYALIARWQKI